MQERIFAALRDAGAAACGVCSRAALTPYMTNGQRARLEETLPGWTAVVVAAFSYYVDTPRPPHALSRYAWGLDYHAVLREHLQPAADVLRDAGAHAAILVDASPIPERAISSKMVFSMSSRSM